MCSEGDRRAGAPQLVIDPALRFNGEENHEGYALSIKSDGIIIKASGTAGLFYGQQTLNQILDQSPEDIRCVDIVDYPDVSFRCIAVDLRFQTFTMDYLLEKMGTWAAWKMNAVLIDYSNNFPYSGKYAAIQAETAFTADEIQRLVDFAAAHYIEIIPCVQSYGHMEYILTNEYFEYLAEKNNGGYLSQICPLHPEAIDTLKDLLTQVYEAHHRPRYMSIGGDEAMHLGKCPDCADFVKIHGKIGLYLRFINQVINTVRDLGATAIVYGDMVLADPRRIDDLADCIIADWDYWTLDTPPGKLMDWETKKMISVGEIEDKPHLKDIASELADGDAFHAFAYTRWLTRKGISVMGAASTASTGADDNWTPNYNVHIPNITGFARAVKNCGAKGLIITVWERHLMETISYGIAAGADALWAGVETDAGVKVDADGDLTIGNEAFRDQAERFCAVHFGIIFAKLAVSLIHAMYTLSQPYTLVEKKFPKVYIPELFGRGQITLEEIVNNTAIDKNIDAARYAFEFALEKAAKNVYELEQWLYGVKMKKFWRKQAALDLRASKLKAEAGELLKDNMPAHALERRIADSFSLKRINA